MLFIFVQLFDESVVLQKVRLERQQSLQKSHLKDLKDFADEFSLDPGRLSSQGRHSTERSNSQQSSSNVSNVSMGMVSL